jgi:hypothetical protein
LTVLASFTRRQLLRAAVGLDFAGSGLHRSVVPPAIHPRDEWASDRPPKGPLAEEDVRFLIVHHSASHNGHTGSEAPAILRSFYDFHTSERGWNDIAYNFLIDSDGGIWEGREGSLEGPVAGDATGGNQGFTQLVCLIGDYSTAQPSLAALTALVSLLAWLAERYDIATTTGSEVSFESRGSNRHSAGSEVSTPTITGHRTMSRTNCPGDNLNAYVVNGLMGEVDAMRIAAFASTTTASPATTTTTTATTSIPPGDTTVAPSIVPASSTTLPAAVVTSPAGGPAGIIAGTGVVVVLGIGAAIWRYRRMRRD